MSNYPPSYPSRSGPPPQNRQGRYTDDPRAQGNAFSNSRGAPPRGHNGDFHLTPMKSPDTSFTFRNLAAVSPEDFAPSSKGPIYILVNNQFVFSALPTSAVPRGSIALFDDQRTWAGIAFTDVVTARLYSYESSGFFLAAMDVELGFKSRRVTDKQFDPDDLAEKMRRIFSDQILAPTQKFIMDEGGIALSIQITTVSLGDFNMEKSSAAPVTDPNARGLLTSQTEINFYKQSGSPINLRASMKRPAANAIIRPDFKFEQMGIGGLDEEFTRIFRRAFASRLVPLGLAQKMQLQHVKGILLFGPPGTGKTLIARKIGQALNAKEPKVINGPEVLNKYVGQSEENIRKLFIDAEQDEKTLGEESPLHIIIFDELDAVCRQRGSGAAGGTGVGDSVVNQLLSKLDGVHQLNNILLIGMTNRMDMIDDALLRPGRLELHVEISLPDEHGRAQILNIHTANLRSNNLLGSDVDIQELATRTKNFSGAEISGLVRAAQSFAFMRHTKGGNMASLSDDIDQLQVIRQDFIHALDEVHSAFGVSEDSLTDRFEGGILHFSRNIGHILEQANEHIKATREDPRIRLNTVLFHGPSGSGKTALAAYSALQSDYPMVRLLTAENMIGMNELSKVSYLNKAFEDAYKSPLCVLIVDSIERIIDWNPVGPRFSITVLGTLSALLNKSPPKGRRLLIFGTTSRYSALQQLDFLSNFSRHIPVPNVNDLQELGQILSLSESGMDTREALTKVQSRTGDSLGIGIKAVLRAIALARISNDVAETFSEEIEQIISQNAVY